MTVCLFDPGIADHSGAPSSNLGNLIIQAAVNRELEGAFPGRDIVRISTFQTPGPDSRRALRRAEWVVVGGTNILTSEMDKYRQWVISIRHAIHVRKAILLGAGWWKYQDSPNLYTRIFLRLLLSRNAVHSVRDQYTLGMLAGAGWRNAVNTACPTMWPLDGKTESDYPVSKADQVLVMLTDYARDIEADRRLLTLLCASYRKVYAWPQGMQDQEYLASFEAPIEVLPRTMEALETAVTRMGPIDYAGTRLHGGIHCLNHGLRTLILEVDNRATEIAKDPGLLTARRDDFERIERWVRKPLPFRIRLNQQAIAAWRGQFNKNGAMNHGEAPGR